jgi:putative transposase
VINGSSGPSPDLSDELPLCRRYFAVEVDCLRVQVRDQDGDREQAVSWAFGSLRHGEPELLGVWAQPGAEDPCWAVMRRDLTCRGIKRIGFVIQCYDNARRHSCAWPAAHLLPSVAALLERNLSQVGPRVRGVLAGDLRRLVAVVPASEAERAFSEIMGGRFGVRYPTLAQTWRAALEQLSPLLELPVPVRSVILSVDGAVWKLHRNLRRSVARRGTFPSREAAVSFVSQVLRRAERGLDAGRTIGRSSAGRAAFGGASASLSRP